MCRSKSLLVFCCNYIAVTFTISEIFSVKQWRDFENNLGWGYAPLDIAALNCYSRMLLFRRYLYLTISTVVT